MKKPVKLLLAVLALGVIAGAYVLVTSLTGEKTPDASDGVTPAKQNLTFEGDVADITYTYQNETVKLKKKDHGWQKTDDSTFPVQTDAADAMASSLKSVSVLRAIDPTDADKALFGLTNPQLTITAKTADGTAVTYRIGIENKTLGGFYAMRGGDETVYLIADTMPPLFMGGLYSIANVDAYPQISSTNVIHVWLADGDRRMDLAYHKGGLETCYTSAYEWFDETNGTPKPVRSTAVTVLASDITAFDPGVCVAHNPDEAARAAYGLTGGAEMACTLRYLHYGTDETAEPTEETFTLFIGKETEDGVYVTWTGTAMVFLAEQSAVEAIRAHFEEDLAPNDVCAVALADIEAVELTAGGRTVRVERTVKTVESTGADGQTTSSETAVYTVDGLMTDGSAFESLFEAVTSMKIEATDDGTPSGQPLLTVRFVRSAAQENDLTLRLYAHDANFCRAVFLDRSDMLVSVRTVEALVKQAEALG